MSNKYQLAGTVRTLRTQLPVFIWFDTADRHSFCCGNRYTPARRLKYGVERTDDFACRGSPVYTPARWLESEALRALDLTYKSSLFHVTQRSFFGGVAIRNAAARRLKGVTLGTFSITFEGWVRNAAAGRLKCVTITTYEITMIGWAAPQDYFLFISPGVLLQ